jgi:hypothetical protein
LNLHGSNPASTSSGLPTGAPTHPSASEITRGHAGNDLGARAHTAAHASASEDGAAAGLVPLARAILERAVRRESLDGASVRRFAQEVIGRESLGALAVRILDGGPQVARYAVELAGAVLALDAVGAVEPAGSSDLAAINGRATEEES